MQELDREANTWGSKAAAIEMTHASVELKILIEQMREQIQRPRVTAAMGRATFEFQCLRQRLRRQPVHGRGAVRRRKVNLVNALLAREGNIIIRFIHDTRARGPANKAVASTTSSESTSFQRRRSANEFIESAEVHGNYYSTSRVWIEERVRAGIDVLLEIDWQGADGRSKPEFAHDCWDLHPAGVDRSTRSGA